MVSGWMPATFHIIPLLTLLPLTSLGRIGPTFLFLRFARWLYQSFPRGSSFGNSDSRPLRRREAIFAECLHPKKASCGVHGHVSLSNYGNALVLMGTHVCTGMATLMFSRHATFRQVA